MDGVGMLANTVWEYAGILCVPSWQAEADPGRRPSGRAADDEPAPVPLHRMFPTIRALVAHLAERWRRRSVWAHSLASADKQNQYSVL